MSSDTDESQGLVLGLVFGLIALVLALVIGVVVHHTGQQRAAKAHAAAAAPVPSAAGALPDGASLKVENGVLSFYFASGKADLAEGANNALSAVLAATPEGKKILVSGFHDATGDAVQNAELAKQRAFAVRDALLALGVAAQRIELKKPEDSLASGSNDEARRVEVRSE
jgi:outer membrane protein OmpA-like peptidoglycan-associated protein